MQGVASRRGWGCGRESGPDLLSVPPSLASWSSAWLDRVSAALGSVGSPPAQGSDAHSGSLLLPRSLYPPFFVRGYHFLSLTSMLTFSLFWNVPGCEVQSDS